MTGPAGAAVAQGFRIELSRPPVGDVAFEERYGYKLDWRSDVGRTGMLLQWQPVGRGVDAGVPPAVVHALAAGLCAATTVVGCTLDVPEAIGPEWTAVPTGHACRFAGRRVLGFGPPPLGLHASQNPQTVAALFDDDTFVWSHESQLLLLAPPGTLPRLDQALVESCFRVPMPVTTAQLVDAGVSGLLRAGVDGDVGGLYVLAPEWHAPIVGALDHAVTAAGGRWGEPDGTARWSVGPTADPGQSARIVPG